MTYDFKNKHGNEKQLTRYMLAKTLSMFEWENLPDTIPKREIEYLLQVNGYAFITKVGDDLYAFAGGLGGVGDAYGNPTEITISNPALNFNKTLSLKDDGVLIKNDSMMMGLMPIYEKHNTMLIENDINMVLYGYNTRINTLISASDDQTRTNAEQYLKKIVDGDIGVIGENAIFDGIKVHGATTGQGQSITAITEYHQYIKASLYNEIGLSLNFNMKRERLTSGEVVQSDGSLFPFVYNMMENRLHAIELLNQKYTLDVVIDFGSVWHQKDKKLIDDITENDTTNNVNEPSNEPSNAPSNEPSNDPLKQPPEKDNDSETQAGKINEVMDLLQDENLTDDDLQAIDDLIAEVTKDD